MATTNKKKIKERLELGISCPTISEWDLISQNSCLKLYHANKKLREAQMELIIKTFQTENLFITGVIKTNDLEIKLQKLRRVFVTANKSFKEKKASGYRFYEKVGENLRGQALLDDQIYCATEEIKKYPEIKEKMEKYVTIYNEKYTEFLEKIAQSSPDFHSIQGILNKYETLEHCRKECSDMLRMEMNNASQLRKEMVSVIEEKSIELKKLNNSLVMLQVRQKQATEQRKSWESILKQIKNQIGENNTDKVTFTTGCYDFYTEISHQMKQKQCIKKDDVEQQLAYIQKEIQSRREVLKIATEISRQQESIKTTSHSDDRIKGMPSIDRKNEDALLQQQIIEKLNIRDTRALSIENTSLKKQIIEKLQKQDRQRPLKDALLTKQIVQKLEENQDSSFEDAELKKLILYQLIGQEKKGVTSDPTSLKKQILDSLNDGDRKGMLSKRTSVKFTNM